MAMDTRQLVKGLVPTESLLNDVEKNCPIEIRVNLVPIIHELRSWEKSGRKIANESLKHNLSMVEACLDRTWESLNCGYWKDVPITYRYSYSFCTILKSVLLLLRYESEDENSECTRLKLLEDVVQQVDKGILLGAPPLSRPRLLPTIASKLNLCITDMKYKNSNEKKELFDETVPPCEPLTGFDVVTRYQRPSLESFYKNAFHPKIPAVLAGCMQHWKAIELWRDPRYLIRVAGVRTVPIEIGSRYTEEDWSQHLITFSEFCKAYVTGSKPTKVGYLAQHGLFDQIPELREDISIPDYCSFSDTEEDPLPPDINAWFGPGGTVSPLHFDPKNNLLSQVFGFKRVILYPPEETPNLYPFETRLLFNTAQVDPVNPDTEKWPKFREAKGIHCTLGPGEMLYIPPRWWHHVTALSPSFSVSFWWD